MRKRKILPFEKKRLPEPLRQRIAETIPKVQPRRMPPFTEPDERLSRKLHLDYIERHDRYPGLLKKPIQSTSAPAPRRAINTIDASK